MAVDRAEGVCRPRHESIAAGRDSKRGEDSVSLLVDLPERLTNWKSRRVSVGRKIGVDLFGEAARQLSSAHPEFVGGASGRP